MLSQSFGDAVASNDADIINAVEFDSGGQYFATGDKGGRIVVFKCVQERLHSPRTSGMDEAEGTPRSSGMPTKVWAPFFQFQSHEPEFDYLKSTEIEEKINQIKFGPSLGDKLFILSTNDKTVKLWKVSQSYEYTCRAAESHHLGKNAYPFPARSDPVTFATPRRIFQNAHAYNINSIAINSDQETFLSCDDLRINLWKLDQSDVCFTLVDIKPQKMEELSEVITACRYHPSHCHSLAYSTSKGAIRLVDTRTSLLCDQPAATLEETEDPANKSYYSEVIASISDINYDPSGRHIVARDYLSLKVWDTHMPSKPVLTIPVQEYLRPYLADLYDTDCILDQFEAMYSADGTKIVTGTYSNQFYVFDARSGEKEQSVSLPAAVSGGYGYDESGRNSKEIRIPKAKIKGVAETRADQKILHCVWHPKDPALAIAGQAGLYIYQL